jgi:hypothetical protein
MKTTVINIRTDTVDLTQVVYIGRPSKWGNPFKIGPDGNRDEVIAKYRAHVEAIPGFAEMVKKELKGKYLSCYCAPNPCHGDVLAEIAERD